VVGLQRSGGGVPKLAVERADVRYSGMDGDWQRERRYHGGPDRALCLYSMELIEALTAEGHPIWPGAVGENVTLAGIDWREVQPGIRLRIGGVEVEVTAFASPCRTISGAFLDGRSVRISEKVHPGWSRVYVRILREGTVDVGDSAAILAADFPDI
jgi:MOSC domain-containing protein YiiM